MKTGNIPHDINSHSFKGRLAGAENAPENQEKADEKAPKKKSGLLGRTKNAVAGVGESAVKSVKRNPKTSVAAAAVATLGLGAAVALAARATKKESGSAKAAPKVAAKGKQLSKSIVAKAANPVTKKKNSKTTSKKSSKK